MPAVTKNVQLNLKYDIPKELKTAARELEELSALADYYGVDRGYLKQEASDTIIQRICLLSSSEAVNISPLKLHSLLETGEAELEEEQTALNVHAAILYLSEKHPALNLTTLQQLHKLLLESFQEIQVSGSLRKDNPDLFSFIDKGLLLPTGEKLKFLINELLSLAGDTSIHALLRPWLMFYIFISIQPFPSMNEVIAMIASGYLMEKLGMDLLGLLNLERFVFFDKKYLFITAALFHEQNYAERLDMNLTDYLKSCLQGFIRNIREAKKEVGHKIKEQIGYAGLSPRQKNNLNYWFDKAFYFYYGKLKGLTDRQNHIMVLLSKYGSLANKDLVPIFQVDRKTIQRDFNILSDLGLVSQEGAGRSLRYHLDFKRYL